MNGIMKIQKLGTRHCSVAALQRACHMKVFQKLKNARSAGSPDLKSHVLRAAANEVVDAFKV